MCDEQNLVPCHDSELAESVTSWAARPAAGHEWKDLVREPFREYALPPITMEEIERRWGPPVRIWQDEDRPFAEFATPYGILRLGLYQVQSQE